jgi:ferric-dicitrate binding protein FerR (iron transport regulator)
MRYLIVAALLSAAEPAPAQRSAATVAALEGTAELRRGPGLPKQLRVGATVGEGDTVETQDDSRVELKLAGGTVLRLGPRSRLALSDGRRQPHRLDAGKLWSIVPPRASEPLAVQTPNAVVVARGATVRVDAHEDRSVLVRVYAGTVSVRRSAGVRDRWERNVGKEMQLLIAADGTAGVPAPFGEADERDDGWSAWNRKRDGQGK